MLHAFNGSDGRYPKAGLTNVNGKIYGTISAGGGSGGYGAVFSITTTGTEKVLYRFAGGSDGAYPQAALINVEGTLFGTTDGGGKYAVGTVFSLSGF